MVIVVVVGVSFNQKLHVKQPQPLLAYPVHPQLSYHGRITQLGVMVIFGLIVLTLLDLVVIVTSVYVHLFVRRVNFKTSQVKHRAKAARVVLSVLKVLAHV